MLSQSEFSLNNHLNYDYHLDISMNVFRWGVIAPLVEELVIKICPNSFLSGTNHETHFEGNVSFAASCVRDPWFH
jgi:hypothetical protein